MIFGKASLISSLAIEQNYLGGIGTILLVFDSKNPIYY